MSSVQCDYKPIPDELHAKRVDPVVTLVWGKCRDSWPATHAQKRSWITLVGVFGVLLAALYLMFVDCSYETGCVTCAVQPTSEFGDCKRLCPVGVWNGYVLDGLSAPEYSLGPFPNVTSVNDVDVRGFDCTLSLPGADNVNHVITPFDAYMIAAQRTTQTVTYNWPSCGGEFVGIAFDMDQVFSVDVTSVSAYALLGAAETLRIDPNCSCYFEMVAAGIDMSSSILGSLYSLPELAYPVLEFGVSRTLHTLDGQPLAIVNTTEVLDMYNTVNLGWSPSSVYAAVSTQTSYYCCSELSVLSKLSFVSSVTLGALAAIKVVAG